jgi:hypothetical protein
MTATREELPVPVTAGPRRRVIIRPGEHQEERLALRDLRGIVERTRVQLRGWDFPHLSSRENEWGRGSTWIESWSSFFGHLEYWRMYQSGQFLHLSGIRETIEEAWDRQLRLVASFLTNNEGEVAGFFDFINFVYSMTEVFEFAARLCQAEVYPKGSVTVHVGFHDIAGFGLSTSPNRNLRRLYRTNMNVIEKSWQVETAELIAASAEMSLKAIVWFFERFQWDEQPIEIFRTEQQKLLSGRL